jgi:glycosyltransferase involved in cell wall biosynthesis
VKVLAAIPCFNTEPFIADVVSRARKYVDLVVVIDDGSYDGTAEVAIGAGAVVISHEKNRGKGAAMKTAVENAETNIIIFLDGDGQHNPEDIPKLTEAILRNKVDLVIGSRCLPGSRVSGSPLTRRLSNKLASFVISAVVSFLLPLAILFNRLIRLPRPTQKSQTTRPTKLKWIKITDCTSGFRAVRKESWQKLNFTSEGFQIETEMIYEAVRNGLTIKDVPISCNWSGEFSRLSILRDGLKTLKLLTGKLLSDARNQGS